MSDTIQDVQQALLNAGTIAKQDVASVNFVPPVIDNGTVTMDGTVTQQLIWDGSRGFNSFKDFVFQANPADTTGTTLEIALAPTNGNPPAFTVGTIVAFDNNNAIILDTDTYYMIATNGLTSNDSALFPITDFGITGNYVAPGPVCFAAGTLIRTTRGEVAVEDLVEGDRVHVLDGGDEATRPVIWIGRREINLATYPDPFEAQPVRIRRDAFAEGMPRRDLLVSPDHAVFFSSVLIPDGVLVPARLLINGTSIVRETHLTKVRYFHVELDQHSILFSENLPTESYLDTGNRSFFQNGGPVVDLNVGFVGHRPAIERDTDCCRPFVYGPASVRPIWDRLARRAEMLGYVAPMIETTRDPAPRISLKGREFQPIRTDGDVFSFILPPTATEVRLLSNAARPCDTQPWIEDHRVLGVSVSGIRVLDGNHIENLAVDGPALGRGWWAVEHDGSHISRWTNGDAVLRLPERSGSTRVLELTMSGNISYPVRTDDAAADRRWCTRAVRGW